MLKKKIIKSPFQRSDHHNFPREGSVFTPIEHSPTEDPSARNSLFSNTYLERARNEHLWQERALASKQNSLIKSKEGDRSQKKPRDSVCSVNSKPQEKLLLRKIVYLENQLALSRQVAASLANSLRESERVNKQLRKKYSKDSADHFRQNFIAKINDIYHSEDPSLSASKYTTTAQSIKQSYFTLYGKSLGRQARKQSEVRTNRMGDSKRSNIGCILSHKLLGQSGVGASFLQECDKLEQVKKGVILSKQNNLLREPLSKGGRGVSK